MKNTLLTAAAATLLFGATLAPAMAQDANGANADANRATAVDSRDNDANRVDVADVRDNDDDGFDWGLLGLLGLLGLIPRKQRTVVHQDTIRTTTPNSGMPPR